MNKVLIAVNASKGSQLMLQKYGALLSRCKPDTVVLLYVEKYAASFLMDEMAGDAELSALRHALRGTEYQNSLDKKAEKILRSCRSSLLEFGINDVITISKVGHPAEEILQTAKEQGADMIVVGSRGKRFTPLMMGSVSREVANTAEIPVLIIK